jgi:alkylation response protein AidB-like acyl-CoA dehydrogenase
MSVCVQTDMASPSLAHVGNHAQKDKYLKAVCSGEKIIAVAITEPNYGSDVANIETKAVLEGEDGLLISPAISFLDTRPTAQG